MRCLSRLRCNQSGFTLIELVIIIAVLGIIAAVAIPRYFDMIGEAREASCRGALGGLRSSISMYYAKTALFTGTAEWPPLDSLGTPGIVLEHEIPRNPYQADDMAPDSVIDGLVKGQVSGGRGGWVYNDNTGEIWANTSVNGENDF